MYKRLNINTEKVKESIKKYSPETLDVNKVRDLVLYVCNVNDKRAK